MIRQVSASRDHTECNEETNNLVIDPDPAKWPEIIMDKDRVFLVKRGPPPALTNFRFPLDKNGRKFTSFNFNRVLSNGESVKRNWLIYSTSKNVLFCFCCKLFAHSNKTNLSNEGFNNWKHTGVTFKKHKLSMAHMLAQKSWSELSIRLNQMQVIDASIQRLIDSETKHWNSVCLAFRGSSDKLYKHNNGNFLKLVQLLAKFDPIMEEHVNRVMRDDTRKVHYLGKNIQNEIITLLSEEIKKHIITQVNEAKYYSIILDCTPDLSKIEQMTMVIRFVSVSKVGNEVNVRYVSTF
ncbi:zinc finger MYM-type protein 1-like [Sitophilus oryzae]|uniref:Zinc finger MYM-type protein 1-like n=1 Tax=Sitophilus oryzae TaxID=7048 RepID=A0A6J2XGV0_SITOR|nr:zinc finger MYM-type protein 1-like [Sitophilus oryzae]